MKGFGLIALLAVFVSSGSAEPVRYARPQQVQEQVHYNPPEFHHYNSDSSMKSDPVKSSASYGAPVASAPGVNFVPANSIFQPKSPQAVAPGAHQSFFYSPKDKSLYQVTKIQLAQHPGAGFPHGFPSAVVPEQVVPLPLLATPVLAAAPAAASQDSNRPRYRSRPKYNFTFQIQTFNGGDECEEDEFVDNPEEYGENANPNLTPQQITGYNRRKRQASSQACRTSAERTRGSGNNPLTPLYGVPQAVQVKPAGAAYGAPASAYGLPAVAVTPIPAAAAYASYGLHSATVTPLPALAYSGQASASVTPIPGYGLPAAAFHGASKASAVAEGYPGASYHVASKSSALVGGYPVKAVRPALVKTYPVRGYAGPTAAPHVPIRVKQAYGAPAVQQQQTGYYDEFEAAGPGNALRRRPGGGRRRGYGVTGGAAGEI